MPDSCWAVVACVGALPGCKWFMLSWIPPVPWVAVMGLANVFLDVVMCRFTILHSRNLELKKRNKKYTKKAKKRKEKQ